MIRLSNGFKVSFCSGSGVLAFDGRGRSWTRILVKLGIIDPQEMAVVSQTITSNKRKGNFRKLTPWNSISSVEDGIIQNVGLTNPGIDVWIKKHYKKAIKSGFSVAASIRCDNESEAKEIGEKLTDLSLAWVELNLECPNKKDGKFQWTPINETAAILNGLMASCSHPLVVKISYRQSFDDVLLTLLDKHQKVEAISAINSFRWADLYPHYLSPLGEKKGGLGGELILPYALDAVKNINKKTNLPIIGGGGISEFDDIGKFSFAGANAYSFGSIFLRYPFRPRKIIRQCRDLDID